MKRVAALAVLGTIWVSVNIRAQDALHLNGGKRVVGRVEDITHQTVSFRQSIDLGSGRRGQVKRPYSLRQIEFLSFGRSKEELELFKKGKSADRKNLQKLRHRKVAYLDQARSGVGKIGLLYAEVLLQQDSVYFWKQAMDLYDLIEGKSWDDEDRSNARLWRIKGYLVLGELKQATEEANAVIAGVEDEKMLVAAHLLLGEIGFRQLKLMQEEHPKWEEDEELRPQRNHLYHETLDHQLNAYLFHGTWEEPAAEGLMAAADLYGFAGDAKGRQEVLEDVMQIYSRTPMAARAMKQLEELEELKVIKMNSDDEKK